MNETQNLDFFSDSDYEKNSPFLEKVQEKLPCDMKSLWKFLEENFFSFKEYSDPTEIFHKLHINGKYGKKFLNFLLLDINNDNIFSKYGFPKNLSNFVGKSEDFNLSKKFFLFFKRKK